MERHLGLPREGTCVQPIRFRQHLEFPATLIHIRLACLACTTSQELRDNLRVPAKRAKLRVVSFAFDLGPGEVPLGEGTRVSLKEPAAMMGECFGGWTIPFSRGAALDAPARRMRAFIYATHGS